jgi:hypothetical protein
VLGIRRNPDNDYIAGQDVLKIVPPPSSGGFWNSFLQGYLFPFY